MRHTVDRDLSGRETWSLVRPDALPDYQWANNIIHVLESKTNNLLSVLYFQVTEMCGEKFLVIPPRVTLQSLRKDVVELLELQEGKFLLISRLAATFRKHHGRKFPLGQAKLEDFIKSLEGIAKVGNDLGCTFSLVKLIFEA